jgi:hypothetical protein
MTARKPFQFSLATLMAAVTGYAVFFGILRSLGASIPAFVMVTLYFTTVVYSQWALFGGWCPYAASFLMSGSLFVLAFLADTNADPFVLGYVFFLGGIPGIGVAGFTDIWFLLSQVMRGIVPKAWAPESSPPDLPPDLDSPKREWLSRGVRIAVLVILASVFFLGMRWGSATGKEWITTTFFQPGRKWRIPL